MTRVAWMVANNPSWIAGINYFRNLMEALVALHDRRIEPVVIGNSAELPTPLNRCRSIIRPLPSGACLRRMRESVDRKILRNGGYFARWLMENEISLLSHAHWLGRNSPLPVLCWITDFQHRRLPEFFSGKEIQTRNSTHSAVARNAQAVLLSSQDARRDFCHFHPKEAHKAYVLPFVAHVPDAAALPPVAAVLEKHGIEESFFYIPNQLWAHKNHGVVVEALHIMSSRGRCPLVVSTGFTEDYRNPNYFKSISARLGEISLTGRFRFLGVIPYPEVAVLMRSSLAVINPSLFEGWSTTVEEAKSIGKRVLLSDIAVHREQAPKRSVYFDPHDSEILARHMAEALCSYDPDHEEAEMERAAEILPERLRQYAAAYQEIVLDLINGHG
ncbi:MAG: glycosyltransferase [Syntrophobacteraceae bacterium]